MYLVKLHLFGIRWWLVVGVYVTYWAVMLVSDPEETGCCMNRWSQ